MASPLQGLKKNAGLLEADMMSLIRSLKSSKNSKINKVKGKSSKATSSKNNVVSLSTRSGPYANSKDWKNWVALHGDAKVVESDVLDVGETIAIRCKNSFQVLGVCVGGQEWVGRGLGTVEMRREIQRLVSERRSSVLCIQETKLGVVDEFSCMSLWGSTPIAFSFKSSVGASVWRVLEEKESLWSLVLRAKYGEEGGRVRFAEGVCSIWWRHLNQIRVRVGMAMADATWLVNNIVMQVGDGWEDGGEAWKWRRRLFSWGSVWSGLSVLVLQVGMADRLVWKLHPSNKYTVQSAYSYLTAVDPNITEDFHHFLWHKAVPLKVNIFV
ncbi:hypothetical protein MTR_7g053420 [Medicago truncatula]|uniref:Endonuclease/exonuclease/phosphatase family protein n=1 Tax=Medicago truncatula TaxID=3880 RepID=A0A072TYP3_MEDTR|nr:hypothetical protein MTR_7g053420 [Medicago truncatula]